MNGLIYKGESRRLPFDDLKIMSLPKKSKDEMHRKFLPV